MCSTTCSAGCRTTWPRRTPRAAARRSWTCTPGIHRLTERELHLLAVLRLDHLLGGDDDAAEPRRLVHRDDPVFEVGLHLVLVPGVGVDHVPAEHALPEEDILHESLEDKVRAVQVDADDQARNEDHDDALDQLLLARPLDLLELTPGLRDE